MSRAGSNQPLAELRCEDVLELAPLYADGELEGPDCVAMDRHLGACSVCMRIIEEQAGWKSMLRDQLVQPMAPASLHSRVKAGLDDADRKGLGPRPSLARRMAPALALCGAAAATALFLSTAERPKSHPDGPALAAEAVTGHERNLPVEVGGDPDHVKDWMRGKVGVPVQPPRLQTQHRNGAGGGMATQASFVGGRLSHLSDCDAAQLFYRAQDEDVSVYVFQAACIPFSELPEVNIHGHELYVTTVRGYSVVFMREGDLGYAITSSMPREQLLDMVADSLP